MLGLANPLGLIALASVAVLIALTLLARRTRTTIVSSLLLWKQIPARRIERQRFRPDLLFLLRLLMLLALAGPVSTVLFGTEDAADLVRASGVALWATVNYEQLTALFRVEERSVAFVSASLANVFLTIGLTLLLVVAWRHDRQRPGGATP